MERWLILKFKKILTSVGTIAFSLLLLLPFSLLGLFACRWGKAVVLLWRPSAPSCASLRLTLFVLCRHGESPSLMPSQQSVIGLFSMRSIQIFVCSHSMDGFRVVKLSEVIRQMDVVITCTGTAPPVSSITSALMISQNAKTINKWFYKSLETSKTFLDTTFESDFTFSNQFFLLKKQATRTLSPESSLIAWRTAASSAIWDTPTLRLMW